MNRYEIYDQFVAHGVRGAELLPMSIDQAFGQIDHDEDDPPMAEIVEAIYATALEDVLYGQATGATSAIKVFDGTPPANPAVVEIVVLDHDGRTIAYRYSTDSQDDDWLLGTPEDAATEAVAAYENTLADEARTRGA